MKKKLLLITMIVANSLATQAQFLREHYISWGAGSEGFGTTLKNWTLGSQVSEDDNFFISRVKPKARFRNAATQVKDTLQTIYDKKLICWLPINSLNETGWNRNALPDGLFDSEVFSMWSYVTHWGDWTASLGRVPAALLDVAHKNGVAVSGVASVPNAALSDGWANCFRDMISAGAEKTAQYMTYYGLDGLGYNSEWYESSYAASTNLRPYHAALVKKMRQTNPLFENIWYTGTNDNGNINFAGQLGSWNKETFGDSENIRTSLFLNYNWNLAYRITTSQSLAKQLGRDPLDLYAGFNMQGADPTSWPLLSTTRYSIGLWGAHSANMFFESRHEKGSSPAVKQATYLMRTERWFTGGTRNPLTCPDFIETGNYNADNYSFHGMSKMMSARSSLSWDLSEEPFITYFNLGNGQYFNWQGVRQHNNQWYNIGMQDYLPTWRYWFSSKILGHLPTNVVTNGLDAEFTWDEAYMGGSSMRIFGTSSSEYLHLFKTQFPLQEGDVITVRYKLKSGRTRANLILTAEGAESRPINLSDFNLITLTDPADEEDWVTKQFTVSGDLAGKTLALVALQFRQANELDLYLGEFSIIRGESPVPAKPVVSKAAVLASHYQGVDGKIIWNMPNTKAVGEPCYNTDVKTSFFKLYSQQEGQEPVFMGFTTSWAGLVFCAPMDFSAGTANKVRFGVAAVSLDHKSQSDIAWSDYMETGTYSYNDNIQTDKYLITPDEPFVMSYVDPNHESGHWKLIHESGSTDFEGDGVSVTVPSLTKLGRYTLELTGKTHNGDEVTEGTRVFEDYVTVTDARFGRLPEITSLTANGQEADITVEKGEAVQMAYTGRPSDGGTSQAVDMKEKNFGFNVKDAGLTGNTSFSLAFWLKINQMNGSTQFFSVANKAGSWPLTDWGWNWSTLSTSGALTFTYRNSNAAERPATSQYEYGAGTMPIGLWTHVAIVFDRRSDGKARHKLYINGKFVEPSNININASNSGTAVSGQADTYYELLGMEDEHYISVGGPASGRSGIDGVIDNMVLYKKAISDTEVLQTMGTLTSSNLPSGLNCLWTLEEKAASDYSFAAIGSSAGLKCGTYSLVKLEGEGRAQPHFVEPTYTAGCPQLEDSGYPVYTEASWKAVKGTITNATGNGEAGSATVTYQQDGVRNVTLTLSNPLGSDSRTFSTITVGDATSIAQFSADQLRAYTVGGVVYIDFKQPGNYEATLYTVAGQRVCTKTATISASDRMRLTLPQSGIYVLRILRDGKPAAAVKLRR